MRLFVGSIKPRGERDIAQAADHGDRDDQGHHLEPCDRCPPVSYYEEAPDGGADQHADAGNHENGHVGHKEDAGRMPPNSAPRPRVGSVRNFVCEAFF